MGVQYLSDPNRAAWFAAKDPEMFAFITGYLQQPHTKATRLALVAKGDRQDELANKRQQDEENLAKAIALLANSISINKDGWFDALPLDARVYLESDLGGRDKARYIGMVKNDAGQPWAAVFSGIIRAPGTRRRVKGFLVAANIAEVSRHYTSMNLIRLPMPIEKLKALLRILLTTDTPLGQYWGFTLNYHKDVNPSFVRQVAETLKAQSNAA